MICHVCQREAIGQCKNCGKFYCPEHGDIYCQPCQQDTASGGPAGKDAWVSEDPQDALVYAGTRCHRCRQPAVDKCDKCGRTFCPRHGIVIPSGWGGENKLRCGDCQASQQALGCVLGVVLTAIFLVIIAFILNQGR